MKTRLIAILLSAFVLTLSSCEDKGGMNGDGNHKPNKPSNPIPAIGAVNQRIDTVFFGWTCTDQDDDVLKYGILIFKDTVLTANYVAGTSEMTTPAAYLRNLSPGHKYFWFVFAYDDEDTTYSDKWYFYTKSNTAPNQPGNPYPPNYATGLDTSITFTWTCSDPDSDVPSYKFFISSDGTNFSPIGSAYFTNPSISISGMGYNTTYYWAVRAFDTNDSSTSPIWRYTTKSQPAVLHVTPTSLDFGSSTTQQTFNITNSGGGTLSWSISDNQTWISVSPTSGSTTTETDQITVTVNRGSLTAGSYNGTVTVTPNVGNPVIIPVTMEVSPQLNVSPTSLNFGFTTTQQTFYIRNTGGGTLNWSVTDDRTWISVSPTSGTTTTETDNITVTVNRTGLSAGSYSGTVTVTPSVGSAQTVTVSLQVPDLALTINNPLYTDMIVQVDGFSSRTVYPGSGTTYYYLSNPGSVHYYAYTSGTTTTGTQVGIKLEWTTTLTTAGFSTISRTLIYNSDYFFLYLRNTGTHILNPLYVNYATVNQTYDNIVIPNNSVTYSIGYYKALSNNRVAAFWQGTTTYAYWDAGVNFTYPGGNNQTVTLTNTSKKSSEKGQKPSNQFKPESIYNYPSFNHIKTDPNTVYDYCNSQK